MPDYEVPLKPLREAVPEPPADPFRDDPPVPAPAREQAIHSEPSGLVPLLFSGAQASAKPLTARPARTGSATSAIMQRQVVRASHEPVGTGAQLARTKTAEPKFAPVIDSARSANRPAQSVLKPLLPLKPHQAPRELNVIHADPLGAPSEVHVEADTNDLGPAPLPKVRPASMTRKLLQPYEPHNPLRDGAPVPPLSKMIR